MKQPNKHKTGIDLRQKAEEKLLKKKLKNSADAALSEADTQKLIHNLEVHQIELEMQEEEILLAKELSELAAEKYSELYDFSPTAYFTFSKDGRILEMNLSGAKMLGKERAKLKNSQFNFFVADSNKHGFTLFLHLMFETNIQQTIGLVLTANNPQPMHVRLTGIAANNGQQCMVTVLDITTEWYYDELEKLERAVLVMNVSDERTMQEVMFTYMVGLEKLHTGMQCCILEKRGSRLHNIASPSMPKDFVAMMEGVEIDCKIAPWGNLAIVKEKIQLNDIENDICTPEFKAIARLYHFKACNCYPLFDKTGEILAVFCVYFSQIKITAAIDEYAIEKAWHILQIILQSYHKSEALKASEDNYRQLVNDMQVGLILQGPDADISMSNPQALELLGLDENQLLGKTSFDPDWNVIHEDGTDFPGDMHPAVQAIATLQPIRKVVMGVYRPSTKDRVWLLVDAIPQLKEDGSLHQVVVSFSNITSQIMAQKSLQKSRLLLSETEEVGKIGGWEFDVATLQQTWTEETFRILEIDVDNGTPEVPEGTHFFAPSSRPLAEQAVQRAIEYGEAYNEEWEIITMKGNKRWVHVVAKAEQVNGKTVKVFGSFQDISKRKKAEIELKESEHRFRSLLDNLDAGIVVHAADTSIIHCNPKASSLLGLSLEQLTGKLAIDDAWHFMFEDKMPMPLEKYPVNQILKTWRPINNFICGVNRSATNDVVWLIVNGFPVMDSSNQIKEIVISFIDITGLKLAEENLQQSNANLAQFAYAASHDLQEPLRMVIGFLKLIEKKYVSILDDTGKSYINYAVDGANRMQQLIQDLLEFARIGKAIYNLEIIDINSLIADIELLYQQKIADKNAIIEVANTLPTIQGYKAPILQVFLNLINNALKYSLDGIQPHIIIGASDTSDYWQFSIADNGIGIPKKDHEKVFEIFKRLHSKEEYSGTGIGLAVTKKVIELQGGKIWLESEEGKGSTFYFTIKK